MIDLYYWTTPNGHKITIFLEEAGLGYKIVPVNIRPRLRPRSSTSFTPTTAATELAVHAFAVMIVIVANTIFGGRILMRKML